MSRSTGGAAMVAALSAAVVGLAAAPVAGAKGGVEGRAAEASEAARLLGLPSLDTAQRYNLAPASRTLRPVALDDATPLNADFVTAASLASEEDGHKLDADPTSRRAKVGGSWVRSAGADEPLAQFSYALLRPRGSGPVRLRIEEAGAEQAQYDVLVNGVKVHHRGPNPQERGQYGGQVGLVHYEIDDPARRARQAPRRGALPRHLPQRRRARPRRADRAGVGDRRPRRARRARRRRPRRALRRHRRQRRAR